MRWGIGINMMKIFYTHMWNCKEFFKPRKKTGFLVPVLMCYGEAPPLSVLLSHTKSNILEFRSKHGHPWKPWFNDKWQQKTKHLSIFAFISLPQKYQKHLREERIVLSRGFGGLQSIIAHRTWKSSSVYSCRSMKWGWLHCNGPKKQRTMETRGRAIT